MRIYLLMSIAVFVIELVIIECRFVTFVVLTFIFTSGIFIQLTNAAVTFDPVQSISFLNRDGGLARLMTYHSIPKLNEYSGITYMTDILLCPMALL